MMDDRPVQSRTSIPESMCTNMESEGTSRRWEEKDGSGEGEEEGEVDGLKILALGWRLCGIESTTEQ